ncbi:MAG: hypothetical protein ACYCPR_03680 [Thermoplasmataceae archaeon]|jgi:hypothetical protein
MRIAGLGDRYISYMVEQSFLIPLSSIVVYLFGVKPVILSFFLVYKIDFQGAIKLIFETQTGWINIVALFLVSIIYYFFETLTDVGVGTRIFGFFIITKYQLPHDRVVFMMLIRNLIKSFFILNVINTIFILVYRHDMQTFSDHHMNIIVATSKNDLKKNTKQIFSASLVMYYSNFILLWFLAYLEIITSNNLPPAPSGVASNYNFYNFLREIISNNLTLDITGYIFGGPTIIIGTFIKIFSSNILETNVIGSLDFLNGSNSFIRDVLPQFFPETLGYMFGIATAISISYIILTFLQSLIRNEEKSHFIGVSKNQFFNIAVYSILSISLIIIGALIESSLGLFDF